MARPFRKTCICYARTSTAAQKERETIQAQIERCNRLVENHDLKPLRYGPNRDGWVTDDGTTGTLLDGREFATLLNDLEAGKVRPDYLVVYSLSRISRVDTASKSLDKLKASHEAAARIQAILIGCDVPVLDESGSVHPRSIEFQLKSVLANEEFKLIRSRTMSGKARRLGEGKFARGGRPPFGYRQTGDKKTGYTLEPHPEQAAQLRQLFAWFVEGGPTHAARKATDADIPTPRGDSKTWQPRAVQYIAKNAHVYLGEAVHSLDGQEYRLSYPPLIDLAVYDDVRAAEKVRRTGRRAVLLSTHHVVCACGGAIFAKNSHGRHTLRCERGCGAMAADRFDAAIWEAAVHRIMDIGRKPPGPLTDDDLKAEEAAAKAKLAEVDRAIEVLVEMRLEGLDLESWKKRNEPLNKRKTEAQAALQEAKKRRKARARDHAQAVDLSARLQGVAETIGRSGADPAQKRATLSGLLRGGRVAVEWGSMVPLERPPGTSGTTPMASTVVTLTFPATATHPMGSSRIDVSKWPKLQAWSLTGAKLVGASAVEVTFPDGTMVVSG